MLPMYKAYGWIGGIPTIYRNVKSQEERITLLAHHLDCLKKYSDKQTAAINANADTIAELDAKLQEFLASGFDDYYREQVAAWIQSHLDCIWEYTCKQLWFGLNDDGHFVAYIPDAWEEVAFDTGYDSTDDETYLHLIQRWRSSGEASI